MKNLFILLAISGVILSCSREDEVVEQFSQLPESTTTRSIAIEDNIAQITEAVIADCGDIDWATVMVMEVESGYTRIVNCSSYDDLIGSADTLYSDMMIYPGGAFRIFPYLSLLDQGGMKPSDIVDVGLSRQRIGGVMVVDPLEVGVATLEEAFMKGSNIAMVKGCYEKLNLRSTKDLLSAIGYSEKIPMVKLLRAYNSIAAGGQLIDVKESHKEPTEVVYDDIFSLWAAKECKKVMCNYAQMAGLEDIAIFNGVAMQPKDNQTWSKSTYITTTAAFYPASNPQYTIFIALHSNEPYWGVGNSILSELISELE